VKKSAFAVTSYLLDLVFILYKYMYWK